MLKLNQEDASDYSDIFSFTPYWTNGCLHENDTYVCSFRIVTKLNAEGTGRRPCDDHYDLYLFPAHDGLELCIRYGNEPGEYISPGEVTEFMLRHGTPNSHSFIATEPDELVNLVLRKYGRLNFSWKS